jgi:hypothetical protein
MSSDLILQELGIVVAMQQPNPNLVTVEFLKLSGIIPADWELARQPINNERISKLLFTNGTSIVAEPNRIMFGEIILDKDLNSLTVATIATKYLNIFKLAQYQAVGINIRGFCPQPNPQTATQYINHQLLSDGSWQNYGTAPIQAALNIVYSLEGRQLNLEVAAAQIQVSETEVEPIILFSGNFGYNLALPEVGNNLDAVNSILANWQMDLSAYHELIAERFLAPKTTLATPIATAVEPDEFEGIEVVDAPNLYPLIAVG